VKLKHPRTGKVIDVEIYVTKRDDPILNIDACGHLDMHRIVEENILELTPATTSPTQPPSSPTKRLTKDDVITKFADLSDGTLRHLEGDVHLDVDTDIAPVKMPLRLPAALRYKIKSKMTSSRQSLHPRSGCQHRLSSRNNKTASGSALIRHH